MSSPDSSLAEPAARQARQARPARPARPQRTGRRSTKNSLHRWARLLHVYTSMICLLVVLFFSVTGLTLDHPSWTFGGSGSRQTATGTLPAEFRKGDTVDWLAVAEFLRSRHGLRGSVSEHEAGAEEGTISFRGPGYAADGYFTLADGAYQLTVTSQGPLAVLNDLHKGRDTSSSWKWMIDLAAVFLIVISLTGLTMQLFLRKRRTSALLSAGAGIVVFAVAAWLVIG